MPLHVEKPRISLSWPMNESSDRIKWLECWRWVLIQIPMLVQTELIVVQSP